MTKPTGDGDARPILIDLGKIKGKVVRQFREGRGELVGEIQHVLAESRKNLGPEAAGKELVPVVLVYRKKAKRRKNKMNRMFPF
jgi:hypothetical protein